MVFLYHSYHSSNICVRILFGLFLFYFSDIALRFADEVDSVFFIFLIDFLVLLFHLPSGMPLLVKGQNLSANRYVNRVASESVCSEVGITVIMCNSNLE
jgi:hypothetical protein